MKKKPEKDQKGTEITFQDEQNLLTTRAKRRGGRGGRPFEYRGAGGLKPV
ncbi:MAG: hypothetical protein HN936_07530 [Bacteroidetes bacterium]|nr:hypothetical protein [Bacteroidota bacterium]MBT5427215.1 hypothetical protein [Bacteroidota bacterium]MBT7093079.1 hypothetical protein [Bacteroidota bacterium]